MDPLKEARAFLVLQQVPGVGDRGIDRLVARYGSATAALAAPPDEVARLTGAVGAAAVLRGRRALEERADAALRRARNAGAGVVVRGDAAYPARLLHLTDPPPVLFLRGRERLLDRTSVAIVGARRCTGYGRRVAAEVAARLAGEGVVVVSGLALGIDAVAHRAALEAGGGTIAVLGTGIDVEHPRSNAGLFRRIARDGLLVSEFVPGSPALPHNFPRRNRILAALSRVVVVVEAAARSGALITAHHALDLSVDVMAVPGSIHARTSVGTNRLVRAGADPLLHPHDVFEHLDGFTATGTRDPAEPAGLPPDEHALWSSLESEPTPVDELSLRAGVPSSRALAALSALELDGWVRREPGMRFRRRSHASADPFAPPDRFDP